MKKLMISSFVVLALLAMTAGSALAQGTTSIIGTVQSAEIQTDATTGNSTVLVTYTDDLGATQTVRLSMATAKSLGLVSTTTDPTTGLAVTTVNDSIAGLPLNVDSTQVIPDPTTTEETQHPVASKLANFFEGLDYTTIMDYHDEGVGFGVIAQALWLTSAEGSTISFDQLMQAKIDNDYTGLVLADGSTVDNWGDIVKALKKGDNLGSVMSGKADQSASSTDSTTGGSSTETVTGNNNGHGNGQGNSGGGDNGSDHGNNKGNKGKSQGNHGHR